MQSGGLADFCGTAPFPPAREDAKVKWPKNHPPLNPRKYSKVVKNSPGFKPTKIFKVDPECKTVDRETF
jgi:hypothetical protein